MTREGFSSVIEVAGPFPLSLDLPLILRTSIVSIRLGFRRFFPKFETTYDIIHFYRRIPKKYIVSNTATFWVSLFAIGINDS